MSLKKRIGLLNNFCEVGTSGKEAVCVLSTFFSLTVNFGRRRRFPFFISKSKKKKEKISLFPHLSLTSVTFCFCFLFHFVVVGCFFLL